MGIQFYTWGTKRGGAECSIVVGDGTGVKVAGRSLLSRLTALCVVLMVCALLGMFSVQTEAQLMPPTGISLLPAHDTGRSNSDGITNRAANQIFTFIVEGIFAVGDLIELRIDDPDGNEISDSPFTDIVESDELSSINIDALENFINLETGYSVYARRDDVSFTSAYTSAFLFMADRTPPILTITQSGNDAFSTDRTFTISASDPTGVGDYPGSGLDKVEHFDNANSCDASTTGSPTMLQLTDGSIDLTVQANEIDCFRATDVAGNVTYESTPPADTTNPAIDGTPTLESNNSTTTLAKVGDTITLSFTVSEELESDPTVSIAAGVATVVKTVGSDTEYTATYDVTSSTPEGHVAYDIGTLTDLASNTLDPIAVTITGADGVLVDHTAPVITVADGTASDTFTATATDTSGSGVATYEVADSVTESNCTVDNIGNTSFNAYTSGDDHPVSQGTASCFKVTDNAGNVAYASAVAEADTTDPPTLTVFVSTASTASNRSAAANASDASGIVIAGIEVADNVIATNCIAANIGETNFSSYDGDRYPVAAGQQSCFRVTDSASNITYASTADATVDSTAPTINLFISDTTVAVPKTMNAVTTDDGAGIRFFRIRDPETDSTCNLYGSTYDDYEPGALVSLNASAYKCWFAEDRVGNTVFLSSANGTAVGNTATAATENRLVGIVIYTNSGNTPAASGTILDTTTLNIKTVMVPSNEYQLFVRAVGGAWPSVATAVTGTSSSAGLAFSRFTAPGNGTYEVAYRVKQEGAETYLPAHAGLTPLSTFTIDTTIPALTDNTDPSIVGDQTLESNNSTTTVANVGDTITLSFTVSEELESDPTVSIAGEDATVVKTVGSDTEYTATYDVTSSATEGQVVYNIATLTDLAGNTFDPDPVTLTGVDGVVLDYTAPVVIVSDGSTTDTFTASATDTNGSGVATYEVADSVSGSNCTTDNIGNTTFGAYTEGDAHPVSQGTTSCFKVTDNAGNVAYASTADAIPLPDAPTGIALISAHDSSTNNDGVTNRAANQIFTLTVTGSFAVGASVALQVEDSDGNAVTNSPFSKAVAIGDTSSINIDVPANTFTAQGIYTITATYAANGATSVASDEYNIIIDRSAPVLFSASTESHSSRDKYVTVVATDAVDQVEHFQVTTPFFNVVEYCNSDRSFVEYISGTPYLVEKYYTGCFRAIDRAGNTFYETTTVSGDFSGIDRLVGNLPSHFTSSIHGYIGAITYLNSDNSYPGPGNLLNSSTFTVRTVTEENNNFQVFVRAEGANWPASPTASGSSNVAGLASRSVTLPNPNDGEYELAYKVRRDDGNYLPTTLTPDSSFILDITPPTLTVADVDNRLVTEDRTFTITASDANGIDKVEYLDNVSFCAAETEGVYTELQLTNGSATRLVEGGELDCFKATDGAGGVSFVGTPLPPDTTNPAIDGTPTLESNHNNTDVASDGDTITLTFTVTEPLENTPSVAIGGQTALVSRVSALEYTATLVVSSSVNEGAVSYDIDTLTDLAGNTFNPLPVTPTGAAGVVVDRTPPVFTAPSWKSDAAQFADGYGASINLAEYLARPPIADIFVPATSAESGVTFLYSRRTNRSYLEPNLDCTTAYEFEATNPRPSAYGSSARLGDSVTFLDIDFPAVTYICVRATDVAGNHAYAATTFNGTHTLISVDTINPTLTVVQSDSSDYSEDRTFTITADDPDATGTATPPRATGVDKVEYLDNVQSCNGNTNGNYTELELINGSATRVVEANQADCFRVFDNAGNVLYRSTPRDEIAPTFTTDPALITNNSDDTTKAKVGETITLSFTVSEALESDPTVSIAGEDADVVAGANNSYTATLVVSSSTDEGAVTYDISVLTDLSGNTFDPAETTPSGADEIVVDITDPTLTVTDPNNGLVTVDRTFTITAIDTGGLDKVEYLDNVPFCIPETAGVYTELELTNGSTTRLVEGNELDCFKATDEAGNISFVGTPAPLDTTNPDIDTTPTLESNNNNTDMATDGDTITLTFTVTEPLQHIPSVTIADQTALVSRISDLIYTATLVVTSSIDEGAVGYDIDTLTDLQNNTFDPLPVTPTGTDGVVVDRTPPVFTGPTWKSDAVQFAGGYGASIDLAEHTATVPIADIFVPASSAESGVTFLYSKRTNPRYLEPNLDCTTAYAFEVLDPRPNAYGPSMVLGDSVTFADLDFAGTTYICARASDAAGNHSYAGVTFNGTHTLLTVDILEPTLSVVQSGSGDFSVERTFTITAVDPDAAGDATPPRATGVDKVEYLDNIQSCDADTIGTYTELQLTNGSATRVVEADEIDCFRVFDNAGNVVYKSTPGDETAPTIVGSSTLTTNNSNDTTVAKVGETITLSFTVNEALESNPEVTIAGEDADVVAGANNSYTATLVVTSSTTEGQVVYDIATLTDLTNNTYDPAPVTLAGVDRVAVDHTVPVVTVSVGSTTDTFTASATDTNGSGVATYEVADSVSESNCTVNNIGNTTFSVYTSGNNHPVSQGTASCFKVTDNAGNVAYATTANVEAPDTPIGVALISAHDSGTNNDGITNREADQIFTFTVTDSFTVGDTVALQVEAPNGNAVTSSPFSKIVAIGETSSIDIDVPADTLTAEGVYTITATHTTNGVVSSPYPIYTITIDRSTPSISSASINNNLTNKFVTATATDAVDQVEHFQVATFSSNLGGAECSSTLSFTEYVPGTPYYVASNFVGCYRAVDRAGNVTYEITNILSPFLGVDTTLGTFSAHFGTNPAFKYLGSVTYTNSDNTNSKPGNLLNSNTFNIQTVIRPSIGFQVFVRAEGTSWSSAPTASGTSNAAGLASLPLTLPNDGEYEVSYKVQRDSGNYLPNSTNSDSSFILDATPPTLTVVDADDRLLIEDRTFTITASDASGIDKVEYLDNVPFCIPETEGVYTELELTNGSATRFVEGGEIDCFKATDGAGGVSFVGTPSSPDSSNPAIDGDPTLESNNNNTDVATDGDTITLTFTVTEPLKSTPSVAIAGQTALVNRISALTYTATISVSSSISEGAVGYDIGTLTDFIDNTFDPLLVTPVGTAGVVVDRTPPVFTGPTWKSDAAQFAGGYGASIDLAEYTATVPIADIFVPATSTESGVTFLYSKRTNPRYLEPDFDCTTAYAFEVLDPRPGAYGPSEILGDSVTFADLDFPGVTYICARASDAAGNHAYAGTTFNGTSTLLTLDILEPTLTVVQSGSGDFSVERTFTITAADPDAAGDATPPRATGVDKVEYLDNVQSCDADTIGTYTELQLTNGSATRVVEADEIDCFRVFDNAGNVVYKSTPGDETAPTIVGSSTLTTNNSNDNTVAKVGETITLSFTVNEALESDPSVTIAGGDADVVAGANNSYTATLVVSSSTDEGAVTYDIGVLTDLSGNTFDPAETTPSGVDEIVVDTTNPTLTLTDPDNRLVTEERTFNIATVDATTVTVEYLNNHTGVCDATVTSGWATVSGSTHTVDANTQTCFRATDAAGNQGFTLTDALDTTDPVFTANPQWSTNATIFPSNVYTIDYANHLTSPAIGSIFTPATATDNVGVPTITYAVVHTTNGSDPSATCSDTTTYSYNLSSITYDTIAHHGKVRVCARAVDGVNRTVYSSPTPVLTVDLTPPAPDAITLLDAHNSGSTADAVTNRAANQAFTFTVTGTFAEDDTVSLHVADSTGTPVSNSPFVETIDPSETNSIDIDVPANTFTTNSTYTITATHTAYNQISVATFDYTITIDRTIPAFTTDPAWIASAPQFSNGFSINAVEDTVGSSMSGLFTQAVAEAGATIAYATVTNSDFSIPPTDCTSAAFSYTLGSTLAYNDIDDQGTTQVCARATDAAGNQAFFRVAEVLTFDTTVPGAPTNLALATDDDTGLDDSDRITNQFTDLTITGNNTAGSTVQVATTSGFTSPFTVDTDSSATAFAIDINLPDNNIPAGVTHTIYVREIDAHGNPSVSETFLITIDTTSPLPQSNELTLRSFTGYTASTGAFNARYAQFFYLEGTAADTSEVRILTTADTPELILTVDTTNDDEATNTDRIAYTHASFDQDFDYQVQFVDSLGNASEAASFPTTAKAPVLTAYDIDGTAPNNDNIVFVAAARGTSTLLPTGNPTTGKGLFIGTPATIGCTTASQTPSTSYTQNTTVNATSEVCAAAVDSNGNAAYLRGREDRQAQLISDFGLHSADDTGVSNEDNLTNDPTPRLVGTALPNLSLTIQVETTSGSGTFTTVFTGTSGAAGAGNIQVPSIPARADGTYAVQGILTLDSGAEVTVALPSFTIDTTAPTAPATPTLNSGFDTGSSPTDKLTNYRTGLEITGTGVTAGDTARLIATKRGTTDVVASVVAGASSYVTTFALPENSDGIWDFTATAVDIAGNTSIASAPLTITLDTTTPTLTVVRTAGLGTAARMVIAFASDTNEVDTFEIADAETTCSSSAAETFEDYTQNTPVPVEANTQDCFKATDGAGNTTYFSTANAIAGVAGITYTNNDTTVATGNFLKTNTFTIAGTTIPNTNYRLFVRAKNDTWPSVATASGTSAANGTLSETLTRIEGEYEVAFQTHIDNIFVPVFTSLTPISEFTIDLVAPTFTFTPTGTPTIVDTIAYYNTSTLTTGGVTISNVVEENLATATLTLARTDTTGVDNLTSTPTVNTTTNTVSFATLTAVPNGIYTATIVLTDGAGNQTTETFAFVVDAAIPSITTVSIAPSVSTHIVGDVTVVHGQTFAETLTASFTGAGKCGVLEIPAIVGANTSTTTDIHFVGPISTFTDCVLTLTDTAGNTSVSYILPTFSIKGRSGGGVLSGTGAGAPIFSTPIPVPTLTPEQKTYDIRGTSLSIGSAGLRVLDLQRFLNNNGFAVTEEGGGSRGQETIYFGPATRAALIAFQTSKRLPVTGVLDLQTQEAITLHVEETTTVPSEGESALNDIQQRIAEVKLALARMLQRIRELTAARQPTPAPTPEPQPVPVPDPQPEPTPEPTPEPQPVPALQPTPVPDPQQPANLFGTSTTGLPGESSGPIPSTAPSFGGEGTSEGETQSNDVQESLAGVKLALERMLQRIRELTAARQPTPAPTPEPQPVPAPQPVPVPAPQPQQPANLFGTSTTGLPGESSGPIPSTAPSFGGGSAS